MGVVSAAASCQHGTQYHCHQGVDYVELGSQIAETAEQELRLRSDDWRRGVDPRVGDAERRGELLSAFDIAEQGLEEHPGDLRLSAPRRARARPGRVHRGSVATLRCLRALVGRRHGRPRAACAIREGCGAGIQRWRTAQEGGRRHRCTERSSTRQGATTRASMRRPCSSSPETTRDHANSQRSCSERSAAKTSTPIS